MNGFGYIFPFFFIGMFVFVIYFLSRKGWSDLVNMYQFDGVFQGQRFGVISAGINGVNYNNCLVFKYNEQGFYLRPTLLFRLFHKAVFIPWGEIKDIRDKQILFIKLKELVIGDPAIAIMQMKYSTFEKIGQATYLKNFLDRNKRQTNLLK